MKIKGRIVEWKNNKILVVTWINIIDFVAVLILYTVFGFWITVNFGVNTDGGVNIKLPIKNEAEFQQYVDLARYSHYYRLIYCVLLVFLTCRWIKIITDKFPAFGALFQTIGIASKDLINILISIFVLMFGFLVLCSLLMGDEIGYFKTAVDSFLLLIYITAGQNDRMIEVDKRGSIHKFIQAFFIIFLIIFYVTLQRLLISIVIVRYKYLRSVVQLNNEVHNKVSREKAMEKRILLLNLV